MGNPILDFTVALAKPAPARVDAALRAHMAGALAMRARLDAERTGAVPVPVPRRQRQRSLTTILRQSRKAGANRVEYGGAVIHLTGSGSPATPAEAESDVNEWEGEPA